MVKKCGSIAPGRTIPTRPTPSSPVVHVYIPTCWRISFLLSNLAPLFQQTLFDGEKNSEEDILSRLGKNGQGRKVPQCVFCLLDLPQCAKLAKILVGPLCPDPHLPHVEEKESPSAHSPTKGTVCPSLGHTVPSRFDRFLSRYQMRKYGINRVNPHPGPSFSDNPPFSLRYRTHAHSYPCTTTPFLSLLRPPTVEKGLPTRNGRRMRRRRRGRSPRMNRQKEGNGEVGVLEAPMRCVRHCRSGLCAVQ